MSAENKSEEILKNFINKNKVKWKKANSGKIVFVNLSMVRKQYAWMMPKLLFARGIADSVNGRIFVIVWDADKKFIDFIDSFGAEVLIISDLCKKNPVAFIKAAFKTLSYMIFDGSSAGIQNISFHGIKLGKEIYEDILRTSSFSTIRSGRNKVCLRKIFHLLWVFYSFDSFLKKNKAVASIHDDVAYHEGALEKLFKHYNLRLVRVNNYNHFDIVFDKDLDIIRDRSYAINVIKSQIDKLDEDYESWVDNYLQEKFQGKNGREIDRVAFTNKEDFQREEIIKSMGLDPNKKNVVIMAHTFSDAIFNQGKIPYLDYYSWLEDTLSVAEKITNVNWILKAHPSRGIYNESEDSIEDMFKRHKKNHIFMLSDSIGGETVKNITDIMVTIGSNAGAEYSCFGIPVILVGKPFFAGHGYTYDADNIAQYHKILENIKDINKLNEEQIQTAKKVYYLFNCKSIYSKFDDEFVRVCNEKHKEMHLKMASDYFVSDKGTEKYNLLSLMDISNYYDNHDIKKTQYYTEAVKFNEQ